MATTLRTRSSVARYCVVRLGLGRLAFALGTLASAMLVPAIAGAQAGTSSSYGGLYNVASICSQSSGPAPTTSETCGPSPVGVGLLGYESSNSSNASRTASAMGSMTATDGAASVNNAVAQSYSGQRSALTVTGTPQTGDQLVFHFLTSQSAIGSGGSGLSSSGYWQLFLQGSGGSSANAYQYGFANGTQSSVVLSNARQTAAGFDFFLPFTSGGTFSYFFQPVADGAIRSSQPAGTTVSGSITAQLQGVDALTAQGGYISSAFFDPQTGLGSIGAQTTVPEPSSTVLLATGLVSLLPTVGRKRKK